LIRLRIPRATPVGVALLLTLGRSVFALDSLETNGGYVRKGFTVEDGLSSNNVDAIVQTADGFLWVGTKGGLLRFDGRHFTPISLLPQASPLSVSALAVAPDGALWVGTGNGVARIAGGQTGDSGHVV
jgi:ligand-binding sensor domain-containing protein